MNIIFLDMDGVINSKETFKKAKLNNDFYKACLESRSYPFMIDPELRNKINEILTKVPNCKVVWSSTWRKGLRNSKLFIKGFYNQCGFIENSFLGFTPIMHEKREYEILHWLELFGNSYDINKCIIIDDDSDAEVTINNEITKKYKPKFFQTNNDIGINDDVKNKILNYFLN